MLYFYPRSPCGERHIFYYSVARRCHFYPRSPCGERQNGKSWMFSLKRFLSTLSLRRATVHVDNSDWLVLNFYPRSPCGERHLRYCMPTAPPYFYPRSPCGERRHSHPPNIPSGYISIHALLAESDGRPQSGSTDGGHFYPRSPCGERPC